MCRHSFETCVPVQRTGMLTGGASGEQHTTDLLLQVYECLRNLQGVLTGFA